MQYQKYQIKPTDFNRKPTKFAFAPVDLLTKDTAWCVWVLSQSALVQMLNALTLFVQEFLLLSLNIQGKLFFFFNFCSDPVVQIVF